MKRPLTEMQRLQENDDEQDPLHSEQMFLTSLRDIPLLNSTISWEDTQDALKSDPRFTAAGDNAEKWFKKFKEELQMFMTFLRDIPWLNSTISWEVIKDALKSDPRFTAAGDNAEKWFKVFKEELREDFFQLLRDIPWIHSGSSWEVIKNAIKEEKRYMAVENDKLPAEKWFNKFIADLGSKPSGCSTGYQMWHANGGNQPWLKGLLRTLVFSPFKWYRGSCWISVPHLIVFFIYAAKLGFSTYAVFTFGVCRDQLSDAITHGQGVLKNNMLKAWSAEYETLPYPPSIGPFAVYTIEDFIDRINFAVEGFYNIEYQATGHFQILPNDQMHMHFRYIVISDSIIEIKSTSLVPFYGLKNVTMKGHAVYEYDLLKELEHNNLTDVFYSILDVTLTAALHSLRVLRNGKFLCLQTQIHIEYNDNDLNGEVDIELKTTTKTVSCQRLNITTIDLALCEKNTGWQAICVFVLTSLTIAFDVFSFLTGLLLLGVYHNKTNIKNFGSYLLRWWSLVSVIGDSFIFTGQSLFYSENKDQVEKELGIFDEIAFFYGIGCLLCWLGAMRYLKINKNFSLLFHTIYYAKSSILAFVLCTGTLFVGYWACAFVTFGVYHPKFETKALDAETLFGLIYSDDIFETVSSVHYELAGSEMFLKASVIIVIYSFVILFTLLALNLIIALINTSYLTIKEIDDKDNLDLQQNRTTVLMFDYLNREATANGEKRSGIFIWLFYPHKYKNLTCCKC
ncbi:uncharacterized protein LOC127844887 isoform X2 [Dreissena polymorpha]|uniref:uncharacterized protein LOC127844887 isoform X2 n=1 Tax=Dreissena polymorpha TaxID=45954 RepID=UPI002264DBEF|nr:uncharacterized protein LOC127844887 isoform X2 [Dreissena polymorpha]